VILCIALYIISDIASKIHNFKKSFLLYNFCYYTYALMMHTGPV
jgi:hypothetical protein